jgi:hypothetical protein
MRAGNQFRQYTDTLVPLLVESVVLGVLVNLVSDYIGSWLAIDGTTVFIILFLLLAVMVLYTLYRGQYRDGGMDYQKPTEFGSLLSLVFFAQLLFFDCATLADFNKWLLIGAGSIPYLLGTGMSGVLDAKWHEYMHWKKSMEDSEKEKERERLKNEQANKPPVTVSAPETSTREQFPRINMHSVLDGLADCERQPGILVVIIESILSVKNSVTQLEIFEVCRRLSRMLPTISILELIRDLMASFVNIRQTNRKVRLLTDDRDNWEIVEEKLH